MKHQYQNEKQSFSKIYQRYYRPIHRYVTARVSDEESAHDVTQEIFLMIYRFRDSYRLGYAFSTWLWAIAKNSIVDFYRKKDRVLALAAPSTEGGLPLLEEFPCERPGPEARLVLKQKARALVRVLSGLTRMQKRVLWLRLVYRLPYQEIAKRLGLSFAAVKCLAYRSRQVLVS